MSQLPLALDVPDAAPAPTGPGLDTATIRQLALHGLIYHGTHWSAYWKEWHHDIEVKSPRGAYRIWKTDEGVVAMLREGGKS